MKCPVDSAMLVMSDKQGIEIDYCPECRGVWLDRGELDKIIERSAAPTAPAPPEPQRQHQPEPYRQEYRDDRKYDDRSEHHHKKRKKENFLGDLFDF